MNMQLAMRPAYAPSNALGICTYVRTNVLTNVLTYVGNSSCVGNARDKRPGITSKSPALLSSSAYGRRTPASRHVHAPGYAQANSAPKTTTGSEAR